MLNKRLPVWRQQRKILAAIRSSQVVLIVGSTGSGKTTQVPRLLLDAGLARQGMIACTEPRRVAAIAAATRVAEEYGTPVGEAIGYHIRFERQVQSHTKVKFATCGILLREAIGDPLLRRYSCIIVDEAHERDTYSDFLLAYLKRVRLKRPDFKLVVMSATLNYRQFQQYLPEAQLIRIDERQYPIEIHYHEPQTENQAEEIVDVIEQIHRDRKSGDILIFLPGESEIHRMVELGQARLKHGLKFLPLFGGQNPRQQHLVFEKCLERKVVVATNVAESSLTIDGIRYVIDTGLAKVPGFDFYDGVSTLDLTKISQSAANQRAGRAGRTGPGVCIRLYSETDFKRRPLHNDPHIVRSDLTSLLITLKSLGLDHTFPFMTQPRKQQWNFAEQSLRSLDALEADGQLNEHGQTLVQLALPPRLGHFVVAAERFGCSIEGVTIAAMLSVGRFFVRDVYEAGDHQKVTERYQDAESDFFTLLSIWDAYEAAHFDEAWCRTQHMNHYWMEAVKTIRADLLDSLEQLGAKMSSNRDRTVLGKAILTGFRHQAMRFYRRHRYVNDTFSNVALFPGSALADRQPNYVVSYRLRRTSELFAHCNQEVQHSWLEECAPEVLDRVPASPPPPRTMRLNGTLRVELSSGRIRMAHLDVDLARSSSTCVSPVKMNCLIVEEERYPIAFLGFPEEALLTLQRAGVTTLAQLPNTRTELNRMGLDDFHIGKILATLGFLGYVARDLPPSQKVALTEPTDSLIENLLQQPLEALKISDKALMALWSIEVHQVSELVAKSELQLRNEFRSQVNQEARGRNAVSAADVIQEVKSRLHELGLVLSQEEDISRGFASDRAVISLPPAQPADDEKAAVILGDQFPLFKQYRVGDAAQRLTARNAIAVKHTGLAGKAARSYFIDLQLVDDPMLDWDDLFQEGSMGVLRAIERFDYTRGFRFSTYGSWWVRQSVSRAIDNSRGVPVHIVEKFKKWFRVLMQLKQEMEVEPTREDLARRLGKSIDEVEKFFALLQFYKHFPSLDAQTNDDDDGVCLLDLQRSNELSPDDHAELDEQRSIVHKVLSQSPLLDVERECLQLYFGLDGNNEHSYEEIGEQMGVTRERVRQRIESALAVLRNKAVWDQVQSLFPYLPCPKSAPIQGVLQKAMVTLPDISIMVPADADPVQRVLLTVSAFYGINMEDLTGETRKKRFALPRQITMYLLHEELGLSYMKIGEALGRDHSTVMHACEKIGGEVAEDEEAKQEISRLRQFLKNTATSPSGLTQAIEAKKSLLDIAKDLVSATAVEYGVTPMDMKPRGSLADMAQSACFSASEKMREANIPLKVILQLLDKNAVFDALYTNMTNTQPAKEVNDEN